MVLHRSIVRLGALANPIANPIAHQAPIATRHIRPRAQSLTTTAPKRESQSDGQPEKHLNGTASPDDPLEEGGALGRTGGGEPLHASVDHAPHQPKVFNTEVPPEREMLSDAQKKEVEEHNKDFEKKHDIAQPSPADKVDPDFFSSDKASSVRN